MHILSWLNIWGPVLHYGPWSRTMEDGLFQWSEFMVQLPWSDFLKKKFGKPWALSGCKLSADEEEWPCTKKWMWCFFNTCSKRKDLKKIQARPFSCFLLGFTCLHFLLNVSKMWLANLLTTIFTKQMRDFICPCSM